MTRVEMNLELINEVLKYFTTKPYGEVSQLVDAIRRDAKIIEEEDGRSQDKKSSKKEPTKK